MRFEAVAFIAVFLIFSAEGKANDDFVPRCRAGICDDRPECPRTSCTCIYPSRVDCDVYYQCVKGKPTQFRCSPGLLMNPVTLTCDYAQNVNCSFGQSTSTVRTESTSTTLQSEDTTSPTTESPTVTKSESPETTTEFLETTTETRGKTTSETPTTQKITSDTSTNIPVTSTSYVTTTTTEVPVTTTEPPTTTTRVSTSSEADKTSTVESTEESLSTTKIASTTITQPATTNSEETSPTSTTTSSSSTTERETPTSEKTPETTTEEFTTSSEVETTTKPFTTTKAITTSSSEPPSTVTTKIFETTSLLPNTTIKSTTTPAKITSTSSSNFTCPKHFGLFPDPEDCRRFYHCSHGTPYHKWCPSNLHFNPHLLVCDWPYRAGCGEKPSPPPTRNLTPSPTPSPSAKPSPSPSSPAQNCSCDCCFIRDEHDCSRFYLCLDGLLTPGQCSDGLLFNLDMDNCDFAENVDCSESSPLCITPNGLFPNPNDCSTFFSCSDGVAHELPCPPGLHFSETFKKCDGPCLAKCDKNIDCNSTTTTTTTTVIPISPYCKHPNGIYPNPEDCNSFYHCSNGSAYLIKCPDGLHFNSKYNICERPCDAQCDLSIDCTPTTTTSTTTTTTPKPISPYCERPNGLNPNPVDCSSFYQCSNGQAYLVKCSAGLHFSAEHNVCERPCDAKCDLNIDCKTTTTTSTTTTTTTTPEPISPFCKKPNGLNPNPEDCGSFYLCSNGSADLIKCPPELHYSADREVCQRPCDAKCDLSVDCISSTTTSTTTTTTTTVTPISPFCKVLDGLNPNPDDCGSFYLCSDGRAYLVKCPPGLHFSIEHEVCDWPCDANCDLTIDCTPTTTTEPPPSPYCKDLNDLNPNPEDCQTYYSCSDGQAKLRICPEGLHFNAEHKVCEIPCEARCDPTVDCPAPPVNCTCNDCDLPDPVDCSSYYFCKDRRPTLRYCPQGFLFNRATRMCDAEENVNCTATGDPAMCSNPNGVFPFPGDCQKYVYCENNIAYIMKCSPGQEYNYDTGACEEQNGNCGPPTINPHCPTPTGLFPHESNCTLFYHCDHGIAYLKDCPSSLFFNPEIEVCDWPWNVKCGQGSTQSTSPTDVSPITSSTVSSSSVSDITSSTVFSTPVSDVTPSRNSSTITYSTSSIIPSESTSVSPMIGNRTTYSSIITSTPSVTTPFQPTCDVVPGVVCPCACRVPTYDDCNTFYQCREDGTACKKSCPAGLYFNKRKMVCDLPKNVECRDFYFSMGKQREMRAAYIHFVNKDM